MAYSTERWPVEPDVDMDERKKIRVLVVDDSALMRKMIPLILEKNPLIDVVDTAVDGVFALKKAEKYAPDVITLDIDMPGMDGLTTLKHIMSRFRIPVVIVSSMTTQGAEMTIRAFELGAMEVVAKPRDAISVHIHDIADELIQKVVAVSKSSPMKLVLEQRASEPAKSRRTRGGSRSAEKVVAIGISTGGPNALTQMLPLIPGDIKAGLLVVQHMPPGFTEVFASRLNKNCSLEVKEARDGDLVLPGRVLIAPGGLHLKIKRTSLSTIAILSKRPPVNSHRPSADVLFDSVAREYGYNTTGVIMTGMGEDGAEGIGRIKSVGGRTIAQDEESSVVFGMPKAAIERGYVDRVESLDDMASAIIEEANGEGGETLAAAK